MPANEVTLDSFYIDKFEITNAQYAEFLKDQQNRIENGIIWYEDTDDRARIQLGSSGWQVVPGFEDHPVTEVTWFGARAYCQWRGGRLPERTFRSCHRTMIRVSELKGDPCEDTLLTFLYELERRGMIWSKMVNTVEEDAMERAWYGYQSSGEKANG